MRGGEAAEKHEGTTGQERWEFAKMRAAEEGRHKRGIITIELAESIVREELCVFLTIQRPLCAALCRCLCTNTLGRPSRARLCYLPLSTLLCFTSKADSLYTVIKKLKQHSNNNS